MSRHTTTMRPELFAGYYVTESDPWNLATSDYERGKYAATVAALPKPHYRSALEVGCSIGILSGKIAARCDSLLGLDVVPSALDSARTNCAHLPQARFERMVAPDEWPKGRFDLIMLSEVLFFFDRADLARVVDHVKRSLVLGGDIVVVNYLGLTNFPLTGDEASDEFIAAAAPFAQVVHGERAEKYRLDVLTRTVNGQALA